MTRYDIYVKTSLEDRIIVSKNGNWGVIDDKDNIIIPIIYDDVVLMGHEILLFKVTLGKSYDHKYGIFDVSGKELLPPEYDYMYDLSILDTSIYTLKKDGKTGIFVANSGKVTDCIFQRVQRVNYYNNNFFVQMNNLWGIYDEQGEEIIAPKYDKIIEVADVYKCRDGKKYGVISKSNQIVIDFIYDELEFSEDILLCSKAGKKGILSCDGTVILPCEYDTIAYVKAGVYKYSKKKNGKYGLVFIKENIFLPEKYDEVKKKCDCIYVWVNDKCTILNDKGEERFKFQFEDIKPICKEPELFSVLSNGKYGIIKNDGTFLVCTKYSEIREFINGFAEVAVSISSRGLINTDGYEIFPTIYEDIQLIDYKYVIVRKDYKCGLFETNGKMLLPCIYNGIWDIEENHAKVRVGEHSGIAYFSNNLM